MKIWVKVVISVLVVMVLLMLVAVLKLQWDNKTQRESLEKSVVEMKQLADDITRNQGKYVTNDDLNKFAKDLDLNLDAIRDDLKGLGAQVQGISSIIVSSKGYHGGDLPSDHTGRTNPNTPPTCPDNTECPDPYGYLSHAQVKDLSEPFDDVNVPIGSTTFEAWKDKPWTIDIKPRKYNITSVLGQDEDGRHYVYSKMSIEADGKKYPVKIGQAEFEEEVPKDKFFFWAPRILFAAHGGASFSTKPLDSDEHLAKGYGAASLMFSPFAYGKTKVKPKFIVGEVGVGADFVTQRPTLSIGLGGWNIGSVVTFLNNTYITAPILSVDTGGRVAVSGGVAVSF